MIANDVFELVTNIPNGASVAVPPSRSGPAMAATRALITRGVRNLHLIAVPTTGIQADMLIGAGCVTVMESAGVTLDEFGPAPRFIAAVKAGEIQLKDSTCPAIISAIQAGEKGLPFMAMRGLIGSDLLRHRPDYRVIDNPMSTQEDPIVLMPAIRPDFALIHAPLADRFGNVWIGKSRELLTMAHAAKHTLVSVEEITEDNLMQDKLRAPACIPNLYVTAVAKAARGSWPLGLEGCYGTDRDAMTAYAHLAKSSDGFAEILNNPNIQTPLAVAQ